MSFNPRLYLVAVIILLMSCNRKPEKQQGTITGKLSNASAITVYLERFDDKGEYVLDSSRTDKEGNFKLKNVAAEKDYYVLRTDPSNLVFLLLEKGDNIIVNGDAKQLEGSYSVSGSEDSELIKALKKYDSHLSDSLNTIYSGLRDTMPDKKDSAGAELQKYYSATMETFAKDFILKHSNSLVALSASKYLDQQKDMQVYEDLLASLAKIYPESKYVKDFESMVGDLKKLPVASMAPEIKMNTPEGKSLTLSSFKGKVVLIDFWASWCGPCRKENPHVVEMYRKFKNKNFEIFGVSLDKNLNEWKDAVRKDGIKWPQVSDLKMWDSEVVKTYLIEAIPYTVLIDKEGKIIAKGLTGTELEQKLIEVL